MYLEAGVVVVSKQPRTTTPGKIYVKKSLMFCILYNFLMQICLYNLPSVTVKIAFFFLMRKDTKNTDCKK